MILRVSKKNKQMAVENNILLNQTKCNYTNLLIGVDSRYKNIQLHINCGKIKVVQSAKYLGPILDNKLSFQKYI